MGQFKNATKLIVDVRIQDGIIDLIDENFEVTQVLVSGLSYENSGFTAQGNFIFAGTEGYKFVIDEYLLGLELSTVGGIEINFENPLTPFTIGDIFVNIKAEAKKLYIQNLA